MVQPKNLFYTSIVLLVCMPNATSKPQELALLQWKAYLADASSLSSWSPARNSTCCSWLGVKCDATGHVVELSLPSAGLSGQLDAFDFAAFPNLTKLNLNNNSLVGAIPYHLWELTSISWLDLGSNYLTNPDHSRLFPMPALEHMSVSRNKFNGSFPQFILSCTNLKFLDLSKNAFCGYQTCWPR